MSPTKIGIFGTGDVGRTLGSGFVARGHDVKLGSRDAKKNEKVQAWVKENGAKASAGTFAETASHGEIIVLATLWTGTKQGRARLQASARGVTLTS